MKTAKIVRTEYRSLIVGLLLSFMSGGLLFLVKKNAIISEFDKGLAVIIGLTVMGALSAFEQFRKNLSIYELIDDLFEQNSLEKEIFNTKQIIDKNRENLVAIQKEIEATLKNKVD